MEQLNCEFALKLLGLCAGTWFWMWYLVWEWEVRKGIRKGSGSWWNTDIRQLLRRKT